MKYQSTGLRSIILLDDPTGTTVTSNGQTRPAKSGEWYAFEALAAALARNTGVPALVTATLPDTLEPGAALIVPASQLESLLTLLAVRDTVVFTAVIDVVRKVIPQLLTLRGVVAVVEHHQYWAWKTGERADASIFGDLSVVSRLHREVTVTPIGDGHFGRIRIRGEDLPGLLGDYLAAIME